MALLLHLGLHKTGSTSIQRNLRTKAPAGVRIWWGRPLLSPGGKPNRRVARQLTRFGATGTLVYSDEDALGNYRTQYLDASPRLSALRRATFGSDVQVVLYFRPHLSWIGSCFSEAVKWGEWRTANEFAHRYLQSDFSFRNLAMTAISSFGAANVHLRITGVGLDAQSDFRTLLEPANARVQLTADRWNEAPPPEETLLIGAINRTAHQQRGWVHSTRLLQRELIDLQKSREGRQRSSPYSFFSMSQQMAINDRFRDDWYSLAELPGTASNPSTELLEECWQAETMDVPRLPAEEVLNPAEIIRIVAPALDRLTRRGRTRSRLARENLVSLIRAMRHDPMWALRRVRGRTGDPHDADS